MNFKKSCLLVLAGAAWAASAQADALYSEGFEDLVSSGWTLTNNSAPAGQAWYSGAAITDIFTAQSGSAGSYAAANFLSAANGTGSISNWLISPEITLGSASTLTFYLRTDETGYQDGVNVYFSAGSSSSTASFTTLLSAITVTQDAWTQYTITLPSAATGRIAFEYAVGDANNANMVALDSVSITAVPEPASYALMGLGLAGIAALRRRRSAD